MQNIIANEIENSEQYAQSHIKTDMFEAGFVSHRGGKSENQDACSVSLAIDGTWVFCVADGLGGHAGGRMASQLAINAVCSYAQQEEFKFDDPLTMLHAFEAANDSVIRGQRANTEHSEMRTTLVILFIKDGLAFWGHVGDVRLYHLRNGDVFFQTKDHSVPQMLVDTGDLKTEEIRKHPDRSRLLNALGNPKKKLKATIPQRYQQIKKDDYFHLSTDGFWEWLIEARLIHVLAESPTVKQANKEMEEEIIRNAARTQGDYDNLTGLTVKITRYEFNQSHHQKTFYKL